MSYWLVQINVAQLLAPIDSPLLADFVADLDRINQLAERSPGFVWRLQDDSGNATSLRPAQDPSLIINMSVWTDVASLKHFAYRTEHVEVFKQRAKWFAKMSTPHLALWWMPQSNPFPDAAEGLRRLAHIAAHGETEFAFTFRQIQAPLVTTISQS